MEITSTAAVPERVPAEQIMELVFGRWRSQTLYAGVRLGVFDGFDEVEPRDAAVVARQLKVDASLLYRLARALGSLDLLRELPARMFLLTPAGALLSRHHPASLRGVALLEEGPVHYALWKHLPDMIRDGRQNAFVREFGCMAFDYAAKDSGYAEVFNEAMTSYSSAQTAAVLEALDEYDFSSVAQVCDVGGGYGHLLSSLLAKYPHLRGSVLDLAPVVTNREAHWAPRFGVADRCSYVAGDMFEALPAADVYIMKMILHDWNDDECVRVLANAARSAAPRARLLIAEHVVPGAEEPHFAKLFDIHMMCWGTGRERTSGEYSTLVDRSGWRFERAWKPTRGLMSVLEMRLAR
jgi:hypothetical protein